MRHKCECSPLHVVLKWVFQKINYLRIDPLSVSLRSEEHFDKVSTMYSKCHLNRFLGERGYRTFRSALHQTHQLGNLRTPDMRSLTD